MLGAGLGARVPPGRELSHRTPELASLGRQSGNGWLRNVELPGALPEWLGVISGIFRDGGEEEPPGSHRMGGWVDLPWVCWVIPGVFRLLEPWPRWAGAMQTRPRALFFLPSEPILMFFGARRGRWQRCPFPAGLGDTGIRR